MERDNTVSHSQQPQPSASLGVSAPFQLTYSPVTVQKVSSSQLDVTAPVSQMTYSPVTVQNVSSPLAVTTPPSQVSYSPMMSTSGPWFNQFLRPMDYMIRAHFPPLPLLTTQNTSVRAFGFIG